VRARARAVKFWPGSARGHVATPEGCGNRISSRRTRPSVTACIVPICSTHAHARAQKETVRSRRARLGRSTRASTARSRARAMAEHCESPQASARDHRLRIFSPKATTDRRELRASSERTLVQGERRKPFESLLTRAPHEGVARTRAPCPTRETRADTSAQAIGRACRFTQRLSLPSAPARSANHLGTRHLCLQSF